MTDFDQNGPEDFTEDEPEILEIEGYEGDLDPTVARPDDGAAQANGAEDTLSDPRQFEEEINHLREMYLRKLAEFDNYRKRTERERLEREKMAGVEVVQDLLPVIDNFERALEHASDSSHEAFEQGVQMIAKQLLDVLQRRGLERFDPTGQPFDPEFHEAIQKVENSDLPGGTVAWTLAKGFRFGGRLLRPAMVGVVAEQPAPAAPGTDTAGSRQEGTES